MTYLEALKHLEQGRFSPLYFLIGEEPFFTQQILNRFREKALDETARDFNYDQFQGEEVNPEEVVMAAKTFPVMSPRRFILIRNADLIKDDRETLLDYIEQPCETTLLLFVAAKPDLRKKLFATLKKKATVIQCTPLSDSAVPGWIAQEAKKKRIHLSEEAVWYLKEHLGKDLFLIDRELDKLALHLSDNQEVSLEAVQQLIAGGRSHSVFELLRALGEKDQKGAFSLLSALLGEGEAPLMILAMLTRQWRLMAVAKESVDAGASESATAKKVPMPPSLFPLFLKQVRRWKRSEIRRAFDLSLAADTQLKGGKQSASLVLEMLILDLCPPTPALQQIGRAHV